MWTAAPVDCSFYAYFHMYSFINHHSYRRPHITNQAHFLMNTYGNTWDRMIMLNTGTALKYSNLGEVITFLGKIGLKNHIFAILPLLLAF